MTVLFASTIPAFKMDATGHWWHWLERSHQIITQAADAGHEIEWMAVIQTDARGDEPFAPLLEKLDELNATVWRFSLDNGAAQVTGGNRYAPICTGRNMMIWRALTAAPDWIYFADADISAPDNLFPQLLELDWPVCAAHVPTYCLDGPPATEATYLNYRHSNRIRRAGRKGDVRVHWTTAGSLLVGREVFRRVPWRWDPDEGQTDDPATQAEMARLGWPTLVRHDVICTHHPQTIGALETRGHDLAIHR